MEIILFFIRVQLEYPFLRLAPTMADESSSKPLCVYIFILVLKYKTAGTASKH
jgi:hypothetical protein